MGRANKVASGVLWSVLVNLVNAVYGFISVPLLIKYFGKAEYGLIGIALSVNVYMQLMDMGLSSTNVRFFSNWLAKGNPEKVKKLFQTSMAFYGSIGLVNALILGIIAFFSDSIFNVTPEQNIILQHLLIILVVTAIISWLSSGFDQFVNATENVAWCKRRALVSKMLMIIALFTTIYLKLSIELYLILAMLTGFSMIPVTITKIHKLAPYISFIPKLDKETFKEILPYSLNIFSFGLFQFSFFHLRPVILGMQGSPEMVAEYNVINGIASMVTMVGGVFMSALLPSSSKVVATGNKEAYYRVAYKGTKYVTIMYCFCVFGLMSVGADLLSIYVGESYLYLIPWMYVWLFFTLGGHNNCISSLILSGADIRAISYMSIISSVSGILVTWFTVPLVQVGAPVLGLAVYISLQAIFFYTYYWPRKMQIDSWRVFTKSFSPYVLAGGVIAAVAYFLIPKTESHWINVLYLGGFFAILYLLFVFITLDTADKKFIFNLIKRK